MSLDVIQWKRFIDLMLDCGEIVGGRCRLKLGLLGALQTWELAVVCREPHHYPLMAQVIESENIGTVGATIVTESSRKANKKPKRKSAEW